MSVFPCDFGKKAIFSYQPGTREIQADRKGSFPKRYSPILFSSLNKLFPRDMKNIRQ
jgi:hypothetical protein